MNYIPTKERTKIVKKALQEKYGKENVRATSGKGTASSWVEAYVTIQIPAHERVSYGNGWGVSSCAVCSTFWQEQRLAIGKVAREALAKAGTEFTTYTSDDGYGTERSEFSLDIKIPNACKSQ